MPANPKPDGLIQHLAKLDPLGLSKISIFGSPYHGVVESGSPLHSLPPEYVGDPDDNDIVTAGHTYRIRVPNLPPIIRTPVQAAKDTELGHEWRDQILCNHRVIYGANYPPLSFGSIEFSIPTIASDGSVWKTNITPHSDLPVMLTSGSLEQDFSWNISCSQDYYFRDDNRPEKVTLTDSLSHTETDLIDTRGGAAVGYFVCDVNSKGDEILLAARIKLGVDDYPAVFYVEGFKPAGILHISVMKIYKLKITIDTGGEDGPTLSTELVLLHDIDESIGILTNSEVPLPPQLSWGLSSPRDEVDTVESPPVTTVETKTYIDTLVSADAPAPLWIGEEFTYADGGVSLNFTWTDAIRWAWFADDDSVVPVYVDMIADAVHTATPELSEEPHLVRTCVATYTLGEETTYEGALDETELSVERTLVDDLSWTYRVRAGGNTVEKTANLHVTNTTSQFMTFAGDCTPESDPLIATSGRTEVETTQFTYDGEELYSGTFDVQAYNEINDVLLRDITRAAFYHNYEGGAAPSDDWLGPNFGMNLTTVSGGGLLQAFGDIWLGTNKAVPVFTSYWVDDPHGESTVLHAGGSSSAVSASQAEAVAYNPITGELARQSSGTWF